MCVTCAFLPPHRGSNYWKNKHGKGGQSQDLPTSEPCSLVCKTQVAAQFGHPPEQLRLLAGGKELNSDAFLLRDVRLASGTPIQVQSHCTHRLESPTLRRLHG